MDFALFALVVAAGLVVITVALPIATFLRTRKAAGDIRRIDGRLDALETELRRVQSSLKKMIPGRDPPG